MTLISQGQRDSTYWFIISYLLLIPFLTSLWPSSFTLNFLHIWKPEKLNIYLQKFSIFSFCFSAPIWTFKMATNEFCPCFLYNRQVSFQQTRYLVTLKNKQQTVSGGSLTPLQQSKLEYHSEVFQSRKQHWAEGDSDQLLAAVWVFMALLSSERYSCSVVMTGHYIGGLMGLLWAVM